MGLLESSIEASGSIISGAINNYATRKQQQREFEQQQKMFEQENVEFWNRQLHNEQYEQATWERNNEYESASAQYDRFLAAGMSPTQALQAVQGFAAESGASVTGSQPSHPTANSAVGSVGSFDNPAQGLSQSLLAKAQAEKVQEETKYIPRLSEADIAKTNAERHKIWSEYHLNERQAKRLDATFDSFVGKSYGEMQLIHAQLRQSVATYYEILERTDKTQAETNQIQEQTKGVKFDNEIKEFRRNFIKEFGADLGTSGAAFWMQLIVGGKGNELVAGLKSTIETLFNGVKDAFNLSEGFEGLNNPRSRHRLPYKSGYVDAYNIDSHGDTLWGRVPVIKPF